LGDLLGSPFHFPSWVPLNRNRRPRRAIADLEAELNRIADERLRAQHRDHFDLLSALIGGEEALPSREACNILVTILLAAHGVPAAAMAWLWLLLYEHPLEERRLHAEIDTAVGRSRTIGAGDLARMPFTTAVVKETLRLYPPTWLLARQVVEPYELGGYRLIPGQYVIMSPYVLQRDPTHFDRPDDFVPARWLNEAWVRQLPKYAYCPFSAGPRGCLGMPLAMAELPLLTATIARRFRFVPTRERAVDSDSRLILIPRQFEALVETRRRAADYDSSSGESCAEVSVV
jgi:cytochrome P450